MNIKMVVLILFLFLAEQVNSQGKWNWISPFPQGNHLYAVSSSDGYVYFAAENESILRSTDGGESFTTYNYAKPDDTGEYGPQSIAFLDSITGIVCNQGVYRTTDGGKSWKAIQEPSFLSDIAFFASSQMGWIVGGSGLYFSSDKGESWSFISAQGLYEWETGLFSRFFALDTTRLWITKTFNYSSGGGVFFSTNNGREWSELDTGIKSDSLNQIYYGDIRFSDSGIGFTVASKSIPGQPNYYGLIMRSTDFGKTWSYNEYENESYSQVLEIDADTWIIMGNQRKDDGSYQTVSYKTTDNGLTWKRIADYPDISYWSAAPAAYLPEKNIIIGGSFALFKSTDRGESFIKIDRENAIHVADFAIDKSPVADQQLVVGISGDWYPGNFILSTDGGRSWTLNNLESYPGPITKVSISSGIIYLVIDRYQLIKSADGGKTWEHLGNSNYLNLASFGNDHIAYISYSSTLLLNYSDNGGVTWTIAPLMNKYWINSFSIIKPYVIIGGGSFSDTTTSNRGFIFTSSNAGYDWRIQEFPGEIKNLKMVNDKYGYANAAYELYSTSNYGKTWNKIIVPDDYYRYISNFLFADTLSGIIKSGPFFYETNNGGHTLYNSPFFIPFWGEVSKIEYNKFGDILALGEGRFCIYSTSDITPTNNLSLITINKTEEVLFQNYPNPFNPSTTIKYKTESAGIVSLKVYDILGNEVELLTNEYKNPGVYTVTWNANNFPSGVYFYRLTINNRIETRKLLLVK